MPNRLIHAASPYLLQHAHNPVDWFEWGNEALQKAKAEDKPILVSIGYSSCHWCHVMERESFESTDIAQLMNEYFVCIKVDREERPDIDHIYMEAVQAMRQQGGWPLNVFLTPDQKPFFGGTYFPPRNWAQLLMQINTAFKEKRTEINESAEDLKNHLQTNDLQRFAKNEDATCTRAGMDAMYNELVNRFDFDRGGVDKAPKFFMPSIWHWLLRYYHVSKNEKALAMVTLTLERAACGGIYDQLAGGFARYSVDGEWFAPHFEKMLYDNAQLVSLYSEAYSLTKNKLFKEVVYQTTEWLNNEMTHPGGGFYSALDADSEGIEGKFYTWTEDEIKSILADDADTIIQFYQTAPEGNWEHGRNILIRSNTGVPEPPTLAVLKQKLLHTRNKRIRPALDDKILTGWNAMMIQGLIDAYKAFGDDRFLTQALHSISYIETNLIVNGRVHRAFKNKPSDTEGFLEDYAYLIQAYTSLYQVTFNEGWLHKAHIWTNYVREHFFDREDGFFHFASLHAEKLIARKKEIFDNVIPSSNAVMARNLFTLSSLLDKNEWRDQSLKMISTLTHLIESEPGYMSHWGILYAEIFEGITEVVVSGDQALSMRGALHEYFLPFTVTAGATTTSTLALLAGRDAKPGDTKLYVCKNKTCKLPVTTVTEALMQIEQKSN